MMRFINQQILYVSRTTILTEKNSIKRVQVQFMGSL